MRALITALLVLGLAACQRETSCLGGSRDVTVGTNELDTQYDTNHTALFHIYFVPQWPQAEGAARVASAAHGGTPHRQTIDWTFRTDSLTVKASPVSFDDCTRVKAGGHAYDIANGNVFIANVNRDGSLQVKQLRDVLSDRDPSPGAVLAFIRREGG
jgi:hypothetical protein